MDGEFLNRACSLLFLKTRRKLLAREALKFLSGPGTHATWRENKFYWKIPHRSGNVVSITISLTTFSLIT